jgi:4-aminobutyrate aminotransferase-like enzyme
MIMESRSTGSFDCPPFTRGQGPWLYDQEGNSWFDGTAGSGALSLGHNPPEVLDAVRRQLDRLVHTGCKLNSDVRAELMARLCALAPFDRAAALPAVVGTEAVESALKVARAATGRRSVVAFHHAFHGKSSGSLALTWRESFKAYSNLRHDDVFRSSFPAAGAAGAVVADDAGVDSALGELEEILARAAAAGNPPAAVILEPIQVTEGVQIPGARFLEGVIDLARGAGALVIFDEIYTGFGRSGALFYCQKLSRRPDLLLVGKSLGNGFPISAVLGEAEVINALPSGVQTSTYSGHPLASAAALAVIDVVLERRLWEEAARRGAELLAALRGMAARHPFVVRPRGEGMLLAFDLVQDSGAPAPDLAREFLAAARRERLILFGGGVDGATVKLVPPVVLADEEAAFLSRTLLAAADRIALPQAVPPCLSMS